jgi:hypothetical protein
LQPLDSGIDEDFNAKIFNLFKQLVQLYINHLIVYICRNIFFIGFIKLLNKYYICALCSDGRDREGTVTRTKNMMDAE